MFLRLACTALFFCAGAAQAAITTYECKVEQTMATKGLPEVLFIGHNEEKGQVIVSDPIVLYYNDGQPIEGRVAHNNAKRITFAWKLETKSRTNQHANFIFRATYIKANGKLLITGQPLGYANMYNGKGRCDVKVRK